MLTKSKPLLMGILNLTPDSFSDGGQHRTIDQALMRAKEMVREGAAIIDIGGESTRPGAQRVAAAEQKRRVIEACKILRDELDSAITLSIDTTRREVAEAALAAGATIVNDISAGRDDPQMFSLCAESDASIILMHMQGTPQTMQIQPRYNNVVTEVKTFLLQRAHAAQQAGVSGERIFIDPGIGFGKMPAHNLTLLGALEKFVETGLPVVLGASRKRFMGKSVHTETPETLKLSTCITTALGVRAGVRIFRVHDVAANRQAADVAAAIESTSS